MAAAVVAEKERLLEDRYFANMNILLAHVSAFSQKTRFVAVSMPMIPLSNLWAPQQDPVTTF